jgi:hypothetical protein
MRKQHNRPSAVSGSVDMDKDSDVVDIVRAYIHIYISLVDLQQSVRLLFRQLPEYLSPPLHL